MELTLTGLFFVFIAATLAPLALSFVPWLPLPSVVLEILLGIVIGVVVEGLTGFGILHQIGLGSLVDGFTACRTQYLPFCF
jgi:hypothetical protein